jgi:hypothetical protein
VEKWKVNELFSSANLLALAALITAAVSFLSSRRIGRNAQVNHIEQRQYWLEQCNTVQYKNIMALLRYIAEVQRILKINNIDVPPEPVLDLLPPPPILKV